MHPPLCTSPARNEKTVCRSHDVTAYRRGLAVGGGSALAALPSCTAPPAMGLGGFLRVVLRAANKNRSIASGNRTLVSTRVERELGLAPLSRFLWLLSCAGTRK